MSEVVGISSQRPATYLVPNGAYDELNPGNDAAWADILGFFRDASGHAPEPEQLRAEMLVRDLDVPRPWALDPIPFALSNTDWQHLQRGLLQRTELLDHILRDLYGPRTLLRDGGLPPALIFGNPKFALPMHSYATGALRHLNLVAYDIGRGRDGQWRVLADYTEAPQGLGMCLENRVLSAQALPELFHRSRTQRLATTFAAMARQLVTAADRAVKDGIVVLLAQGPEQNNYFEQTYLGQYFGFPVVEGADLTVRDDAVYLKTLEGLKPVGCVLRFPHSENCDPIYLTPAAFQGVAGIVNTARHQQVHMANSLGSGVLENDAIMSFLPGLCQTLLNEDLLLPNIATWWLGGDRELAHARAHQAQLLLGPAFSRQDMFGTRTQDYWERTVQPADWHTPYRWVAREPIELSYSPHINAAGEVAAAPTLLRLFVVHTDEGYQVLPGGMVRQATPEGDISKDLWVPADDQDVRNVDTLTNSNIVVRPRRSDRDLPSRTADDLFWLGRYLERTEGAVRTYRSLLSHIAEADIDERKMTIETVIELLEDLDVVNAGQAKRLSQAQSVDQLSGQWQHMLFDTDSGQGLYPLLQRVNQLANQVRERLSADAWRLFNALTRSTNHAQWRFNSIADAIRLTDSMIERISGVNGQIQENMTRGYGWRLLELGRRLERGQYGIQILHQLVAKPATSSRMYLMLDLYDSTITYRSRYQTIPV
ncbi:MAG: circularly permuted type 2 ATP-grasp protein, partial [Pseudomonadota bacterium]